MRREDFLFEWNEGQKTAMKKKRSLGIYRKIIKRSEGKLKIKDEIEESKCDKTEIKSLIETKLRLCMLIFNNFI